jgi:hypothetical protein
LQALGLTIGRIKFAVGTIQQDVGVHAAWLPRAHFRKIRKTFLLVFNADLATARARARRTSRVLPAAK